MNNLNKDNPGSKFIPEMFLYLLMKEKKEGPWIYL